VKVLLLSHYFPPEIGTGPHLPYELSESLVNLGHDVTVATGFPRYHIEAMPKEYRGHFIYKEQMAGIKVYRVNAPNSNTKLRCVRGISQQIFPWMLAIRSIFLKIKPDIVYTITPPLAMGLAANLTAKRFGVPCVVNVQDLFPQCAVDLGLIHHPILIRAFERMERYIYKKSDAIVVMSEGNRDFVIAKGANPQRTKIINNWVDADLIQPCPQINDFRKTHGIKNEFVVLFAGTMGWSQGLEVVVDAAKLLVSEPDILFLMVGDGVELEKLKRQSQGLANVRFLPMQSKADYPRVLAASNVSLATLRPEVATPTFPSKISTIMAAGRPIIASIPSVGDVPLMINETDCGLVTTAGDPKALANAVLTIKNDTQKAVQMGINGRKYVEKHLSRTICVSQIEELFSTVIGEKPSTVSRITEKKDPLSVDIRVASNADLDAIVKLHLDAFPDFNMSVLGPRFLRKYYEIILNYGQSILLVAKNEGQILGFIAGFVNPKEFYKILKKNKWRLAIAALMTLPTAPWAIKRLLRVIRRGRQFVDRPEAMKENFCELALIAVDPDSANMGVGKTLIRAFIDAAQHMDAVQLYLTTDANNNDPVNAFYRGLGFQLADVFKTPHGRLLNEFVLPLNAAATASE
jgi:colanic acid biosynthesis glycosyl transferase WcaI